VRAVVQRVTEASVTVDGQCIGEVGLGLMVLLGVTHDDGPEQSAWLAAKLAGLRIFSDESGKMNRSVVDVGGAALVVSQFTLYGDTRKGRRPSFVKAARPELADPLYQRFCDDLRAQGVPVQTGEFGGDMKVRLLNDGPVTLIVETP